jgi:hypothetical protein
VAGLQQFLSAQIAIVEPLLAQLESPENPIPLTTADRSLINKIRTNDADLLDLLLG